MIELEEYLEAFKEIIAEKIKYRNHKDPEEIAKECIKEMVDYVNESA